MGNASFWPTEGTDLDLGNYERYLGIQLSHESNMTTGKIYKLVIEKERRGDYLGRPSRLSPTSQMPSRNGSSEAPRSR